MLCPEEYRDYPGVRTQDALDCLFIPPSLFMATNTLYSYLLLISIQDLLYENLCLEASRRLGPSSGRHSLEV